MKKTLTKIKDKILAKTKLSLFADDIGIRRATLYDFLNEKIDVKLPTLMRIIEPLNMGIIEQLPEEFIEVQTVYLNGKTFKKGDKYKRKKVLFCFGTKGSSYQGMLLESNDKTFALKVF